MWYFKLCELKNKKGVNLPGVRVSLPGITEKDAEDIRSVLKKMLTSLQQVSYVVLVMF